MRIEQLMKSPAISCSVDGTAALAAKLMWDHDVGVIPLLGDDQRVVGIITDRDLAMAAYTQGKPFSSMPLRSCMSKSVFSCRPTDSFEVAERLMREKQVHRLPVIDAAGKLCGMVSLNDLARSVLSQRSLDGAGEDLLQAMVAVTAPRRSAGQAVIPRESVPRALVLPST